MSQLYTPNFCGFVSVGETQYIHAQYAGKEGIRNFSSKMPRTESDLQHFPRRPFLYAHLCLLYLIYGYRLPEHDSCSPYPSREQILPYSVKYFQEQEVALSMENMEIVTAW